MVKIAYRITAVRSREKYAIALCDSIDEPRSSIMWDEALRGSQWNKNRTIEEVLDQGYTHVCLLDDDAIVVNNFKGIVQQCVEHFPDAFWTFFSDETHSLKDKPASTPYLELFNKNCKGIGLVMPVQHIRPYLEFYEKEFAHKYPKWNHDDTAKKMYCLLNNIRVMMPIPNLIFARQIRSAMPTHHNITPNSDCWQGKDLDLRQFDTYEFEVDKVRSMFWVHLDKNEEIVQRCVQKFRRNKMLEKAQRR